MLRLNTPEAQQAWEEYKNHLIDVGFLKEVKDVNASNFQKELNRMNIAKMAFKQGYAQALGAQSGTEHPEPKFELVMDVKTTKRNRTQKEIEEDNQLVYNILSSSLKPMKVGDITTCMRSFGREHWDKNNTSGFIKYAMKSGYPIIKVAYGVYGIEGRDKEENDE